MIRKTVYPLKYLGEGAKIVQKDGLMICFTTSHIEKIVGYVFKNSDRRVWRLKVIKNFISVFKLVLHMYFSTKSIKGTSKNYKRPWKYIQWLYLKKKYLIKTIIFENKYCCRTFIYILFIHKHLFDTVDFWRCAIRNKVIRRAITM